jgi:hypothetical protein
LSTGTRIALVAAAFATALPAVALAASTSVTITPPATGSFAVTLDGTDKTGTYSLAIPVAYTSNGNNKFATAGWHITATSTTFKGNTTLRTLSTTASTITAFPDSVGCTQSNCTDTTNSLTYPITIPAATVAPAPVTVFNATAPSGAGGNTVTMQVSVAIPANTFADAYASTLTLAIIEGP